MTGNATMTRRATGCLKKVAPEKKVFGHFLLLDGSIWIEKMLYDQGILLHRSGYPTCLYSEKIDPRPPRAQKRAKKALLGTSTEKSECRAAKPPKLRSFWHQPICGSFFRFRATEFLPVASGSKISIFTHITPIFWGQMDPTQWDLKSPIS